jgi:hypothetical protein
MSTEANPEHEHVYPRADWIEHELDGDKCICGPTLESFKSKTGMIRWRVTHHSLDGREKK